MSGNEPVLVTGGSGYIASFCIARLLQAGRPVRTTIRDLARAEAVRGVIGKLADASAVEFAAADLNADGGWAEAANGCQLVLHVASPLPARNPKDDDELVRPARDGALRVLRAARDAGCARVVMTSSTAAIAYGRGGRDRPFTEADWSDETGRSDSSAYERSKVIAERAAWEWLAREGGSLELTTICPGAVLGPVLGLDFSASIEIVKKLMDGSVPGIPRFGWPLVDVRDIAELHVRAMEAPAAAGQRYAGTGAFAWMSEIAQIVRDGIPEIARRVPKMQLPDFAVRAASLFDPVIRERLFELGKFRPVSAEKASRDLGWRARPHGESILDTARSLIAEGVVKA